MIAGLMVVAGKCIYMIDRRDFLMTFWGSLPGEAGGRVEGGQQEGGGRGR